MCKRFIEGNVNKRKSCRRWGEPLDHDAGETPMKEKGRKEGWVEVPQTTAQF